MRRYLDWIKQHKTLVFSLAGLTLLLIVVFFAQRAKNASLAIVAPTPTPVVTPPPPVKADWGELSNIVKSFGTPLTTSTEPNRTDTFKSDSLNRNNTVIYQQNVPVFALQVVTSQDKMTISTVQNKYGDPTVTLFSPASSDTDVYLYAYPEKGIAYQANAHSGVLYEVWYFRPMTEKELQQTWAKDFSNSLQEGSF